MSRKKILSAGSLFFMSAVMSMSAYGSALLPGGESPYDRMLREKAEKSGVIETDYQKNAAQQAAEKITEQSAKALEGKIKPVRRKSTANRPSFSSTVTQTATTGQGQDSATEAAATSTPIQTSSDKDEVLTVAAATQGQTALTAASAVSQNSYDNRPTQGNGKTQAQKDEDERERLAAQSTATIKTHEQHKIEISLKAAADKKREEQENALKLALLKRKQSVDAANNTSKQTITPPSTATTSAAANSNVGLVSTPAAKPIPVNQDLPKGTVGVAYRTTLTPAATPNRVLTPTNTPASAPIPTTPIAASSPRKPQALKTGDAGLMRAIKSNNIEKALELIHDGDDISVRDSYGRSLMHYAQDAELIKKLKEKMTVNDVDHDGCTPLMIAVQLDQIEQAKLLLKDGADVTAQNFVGQTALDFSKTKDFRDLLEAPGLSAKDEDYEGRKPLTSAIGNSKTTNPGEQGQVATATKPIIVQLDQHLPQASGAAGATSTTPTVTKDEAQKEVSRREFLSTIQTNAGNLSAVRAARPTAASKFGGSGPTLTLETQKLIKLDKSSNSVFFEIKEDDSFWNGGSLKNDSKKTEILEIWGKIANKRSSYIKEKLCLSDDTELHNLALRSLGALPLPQSYTPKSEDFMDRIQHCRTKILSTGGAFGIDFERKAKGLELQIMVNSLKDAGRYQAMRYKPDQGQENAPSNLLHMLANDLIDETSPAQLLEHQIVCFIVAAKEAMKLSDPAKVAFSKWSEGRYKEHPDYKDFAYWQIAETVQKKVGTKRDGQIDKDFVCNTLGRINKDIADFTDERASAH